VALGYDQHVAPVHRISVEESQCEVVLGDYFVFGDAAKCAFGQ